MNSPRKIIAKTRDRLFSGFTSQLTDLAAKVEKVEQNQNQAAQAHANLLEKVHNSGALHISDHEIVAKIFTGQKMYLDPTDLSVVPHLALDGRWEADITTAWLNILKPTDTVMDIGANFGYFGVIAAQRMNRKKSKVVLFEANPRLIPYIRKTLAVNWINEQSVVENVAVSDKAGRVTLSVLKDYIGSSSIQPTKKIAEYMRGKMYVETEEKVAVDATTIDTYCQKNDIARVDLIKMDIEGAEEKAYQGMRGIVKASPNITLFIEFTKESYDDPKRFYSQLLADFGHIYLVKPDGSIARATNTSYEAIIDRADDWVMPVFSKNSKLANS